MAPTAITATPASAATSCRIRSANGVWYERPNAGRSSLLTCPDDTSMPSAPWAMNARAIATASCSVLPSGTQSVAEIRTITGLSAGQAARTASNTSSGNRSRFATQPP